MTVKERELIEFYQKYYELKGASEQHLEFNLSNNLEDRSFFHNILNQIKEDQSYLLDNQLKIEDNNLIIEISYQLKKDILKVFPYPQLTKELKEEYKYFFKEKNIESATDILKIYTLLKEGEIEDQNKFMLTLFSIEMKYLNENGEDILHYYPIYSLDLTSF
jgi:hypothetical protein